MLKQSLRVPAEAVRRMLIAAGLDRPLAEFTADRPTHWLARLFRPDIDDYRHAKPRRAIRNGIAYDLSLGDYIEWTIYFGIEHREKTALFSLAQTGQTVIDVGTNVGEVLMNFAQRVGPKGRAIGFEPNPETLARCRHNLALNSFANAEVHGVALGAEPGSVRIGRPQQANAGADRVVHSDEGIEVRVTTIDEMVGTLGLERVDLIKIDVEGYDLNVLRGSAETIERFRPTMFVELCDSNLREQGDSASGLVEWLEQRGYQVSDGLTRESVRSSDDLGGCFRDILARPA